MPLNMPLFQLQVFLNQEGKVHTSQTDLYALHSIYNPYIYVNIDILHLKQCPPP